MPATTHRAGELWRFVVSMVLSIAMVAAMIHFVVIALRASHAPTPTETHVLRLRGHGLWFSDAGWNAVKRDAWIAAASAIVMFGVSLTRLKSQADPPPPSADA